jgi:hypothetical protein
MGIERCTLYICPECGKRRLNVKTCGGTDKRRHDRVLCAKVHYVRADDGAIDLIHELVDAGTVAQGPNAEYEEHERWRQVVRRARIHLGEQ